jgi:surfactin synthase thioesterase subunit
MSAISYPTASEFAASSTLPEIAAEVAARIEEPADGAFAFFGHSMGALVAYETTRCLREAGRPGPSTLFASGHGAPHLPSPGPVLHVLGGQEFWREMAALDGIRHEVMRDPALCAAIEPRLRGELRAAETYHYRAGYPLGCDVVGLTGQDDRRAPVEDVMQWQMHTLGRFDMHVFPGGHFFLETAAEAVVGVVADRLTTSLA